MTDKGTPSALLEADAGRPKTESTMPAEGRAAHAVQVQSYTPALIYTGGAPPERLRSVEFYSQPDGNFLLALRGNTAFLDVVVTPAELDRLSCMMLKAADQRSIWRNTDRAS